jgi:hypothetical protein
VRGGHDERFQINERRGGFEDVPDLACVAHGIPLGYEINEFNELTPLRCHIALIINTLR